jgi:hypothetical protein
MANERRNAERLYPKRSMQLIFNGGEKVVGRIYNISAQGASFEYDSPWRPALGNQIVAKIAIDLQSNLVVDDIHCTAIYDIPTLAQDQTFRGSTSRLCGLEFHDLDPSRQDQLSHLLASVK